MKYFLKYSSLIVVILISCKKEEITIYQDDPGVYFTTPSYSYSFTEDINAASKTIYLPIKLSGNKQEVDRSFKVEVVKDTNTTVQSDLYEIQPGELLKNSFDGRVPVILKRNATVDTSIVKLRVKLVGSADLDPMLTQMMDITWTGKIIQPVNWKWLKFYFGTPFSSGWYTFMIQAAGVSSFPYDGTLSKTDPVTWWWSAAQVQAYALKVKEALIKYNTEHPGNELKHNDGPNAGQLVTMPI
jgi:hypothetical protein